MVVAPGQQRPGQEEPALHEVCLITHHDQRLDRPGGSRLGLGDQPRQQQDLATVGFEHRDQPRWIAERGVGGFGSIERCESVGKLTQSAEGKSEVVGGHRDEDGQIPLAGDVLGPRQVLEAGRSVALIGVEDSFVEVHDCLRRFVADFPQPVQGSLVDGERLAQPPRPLQYHAVAHGDDAPACR